MSIVEQLRTARGQIANDRAWQEPRRLLEDLEPELAQLRGELTLLENPPASIKSTAERILREWNPSPTDPKGLATAVRELRSAAIGALQTILEKPAEIAALLEEIETVNPATFTSTSPAVLAAVYRRRIAPLLGNAAGLENIVDELLRQEQEAFALAKQHLEAQQANQGEPVAKPRRTVSTVHDDEPKHRPSGGFSVLSGPVR